LGAARELDVLCSTLQEQPSLHRSDAGRRLRQHAQAAREEALAAALAASGPRRQMSTLLQLQGAMLRLRGGASAEAPAASLVAEGLDALRRRVRRRLREVDAAAHPGRAAIAAAAIGVTTRDPTRIGALADDLGGLQDIAAARRQLREWANADTRLASPIADLVAGLEPRHRRLLARALRRARQI
jgi:CHAD domain-containing protein